MRKSEFVAKLAEVSGITQKDCEVVLDAMNTVIVEQCVGNGEEISVPFGKFKQKINSAKTGVNPLTKKQMNVPESHTVSFKPSKTIKTIVDPKAKTKRK